MIELEIYSFVTKILATPLAPYGLSRTVPGEHTEIMRKNSWRSIPVGLDTSREEHTGLLDQRAANQPL